MEIKLKELNHQRVKLNIVCFILQTILSISMFIASISVSINGTSTESIVLTWLFGLYFLYGNLWIGFLLALDLRNKITNDNEIKLLFSGIGSIISIFTLISWIVFVREIYYERKYSIDLLENKENVEDKSSKGE